MEDSNCRKQIKFREMMQKTKFYIYHMLGIMRTIYSDYDLYHICFFSQRTMLKIFRRPNNKRYHYLSLLSYLFLYTTSHHIRPEYTLCFYHPHPSFRSFDMKLTGNVLQRNHCYASEPSVIHLSCFRKQIWISNCRILMAIGQG